MPRRGFQPAPPRAPLFGLPGSLPTRQAGSAYAAKILGTPGLVSYWRLCEPAVPADWKDSNPGTRVGGVTQFPGLLTGDGNSSYDFDGSTGRVNVTDANNLDFTTAFTFECWVNLDALGNIRFVDKSIYWLRLIGGKPAVNRRSAGVDAELVGTDSLSTGTTYHLVGTYDNANLRLYVNGAEVAPSPLAASGANETNTDDFSIGASMFGFDWVDGRIDEVAVYNVALTPAQIADHFNVGIGGPGATPVDGAPLNLVWDTVAQVDGGQLDLLWDLRTPVDGGQLDLLWDLRSQVDGAQLDLLWDLVAQVNGAALDLIWDLRAAVDGPALDLLWDLAAGDAPPVPLQTGAAGGRTFDVRWSEVDGPALTLRWGSVESPRAGEGALIERARPVVEPVERAPARIRRRQRPRVVERPRPRVAVDAVPLELRWAVRGAVQARLALKWAATEDALIVGRLQARVAAYTAEVARLTREVDRARTDAEAAAEGRIDELEGEVARLRDEAESLELLLLSE